MKMQPLDRSRYGEWDRFVVRAKGTIFHTAWWYDAWGADFVIYAGFGNDGEIVSGMPVHIGHHRHMPRLFGIKGLTRPPLTLANGPLFLESKKSGISDRYAHSKREVLDTLTSLPKLDYYDILLHSFHDDLMPYIWNGFDTQVYYTYVIPRGEADTWHKNIRGTARENLKKARREAETCGYSIEADPPLKEIIPIFCRTAESNGYAAALGGITGMMPGWWETVMGKGAGRSYLLRSGDGKALCAAIMVWDDHTAYSIIGGMDPIARNNKGIGMLLWERRITDALSMGLDFDFEGSTLMGVEGFIRRWGGELRPCFRLTKVPSLLTYTGIKAYRYLKFHRKPQSVCCEAGQENRQSIKQCARDMRTHPEATVRRPMVDGSEMVGDEKYTKHDWSVKERILV